MRLVVQRVLEAKVHVDGALVGCIKQGYLIYVGIKTTDTMDHALRAATKVHNLRVFEDEQGKMNLPLSSVDGSILAISQFTLYGDTKGNNRPSFILAARPEQANPIYEKFCEILSIEHPVHKGIFGADMKVSSINDGPVTIMIDID
jgi:D-tyrosyl-tRNA(Tyr) deacylase